MKRTIHIKSSPADSLISVDEWKKALNEADIVATKTLKLKIKISKLAYLLVPVWYVQVYLCYKPFLPKCFIKLERF